MTDYQVFHLAMKCIGIGFLLLMAALVVFSLISEAADYPDEDGERM